MGEIARQVQLDSTTGASMAEMSNRKRDIPVGSLKMDESLAMTADEAERAVQSLAAFLRFESVSGTGDQGSYDACVAYLVAELTAVGLLCQVLPESLPGKPLLVATWEGSQPELPCLILNSHYDVVPIIEESWTVPAFEGLRTNGRVYGRGAQDMKCVCIQYVEAVRRMKTALDFKPVRTMHLTFVPDEEIGGVDGMCIMLQSAWFAQLSAGAGVGLALDEGLASEDGDYAVFYGERLPWWIRVKVEGSTGHGSRFIDGTAVERVVHVVNQALAYREAQRLLLHGGCAHAGCDHSVAAANVSKKRGLGDVTSLNVTRLQAGIMSGGQPVLNVIPSQAEACFDIRISPHTPPSDIADEITRWCAHENDTLKSSTASAKVTWEWVTAGRAAMCHATTPIDKSNPWWGLFAGTIRSLGIDVRADVFPAATDSRFLRAKNIRALGFSPMRHSPILLHEHDEYLDESVFVEGCNVYVHLLSKLAANADF